MNLKTLLLSTLFVAIAYTTCTEARRSHKSRHSSSSNRRTSVTHHSSSRHSTSGSASRHSTVGGHQSSSNTYPKQQTHNLNTGYVASHHTDASYGRNKPAYSVNSHNQNSHSGNDDNTAGYVIRSTSTRRRHRNRHRHRKTKTTTTKPCINKDLSLNNNHPQQNLDVNCNADIPAEISTNKPTNQLRKHDSNLDDDYISTEISTSKPSNHFFGIDVGFLRH